MHRAAVLGLLRAHLPRVSDPHETEMTASVIRYVEEQADCFLRTCVPGHLTGSAWIVDPPRRRVLLVHHRKLNKWLQPGGHADGDSDLPAVAAREAREETGLTRLRPMMPGRVFDVDCHRIPARADTAAHWHHDLRFLFEADPAEPLVRNGESHALAWVELERVVDFNSEESLLRLARKTAALDDREHT